MYNTNSRFAYVDDYKDVKYTNSKFSTKFDDTRFLIKFQIGDLYWNGEEWKSYSKDYLPEKDYMDKAVIRVEEVYGVKHYYCKYNGTEQEITEQEVRRIECKDRFYVIRKNKEGDSIYNTWRPLDNQVSYKLNLVDAEDGILIPLPSNQVMTGKFLFELYTPNDLGRQVNSRTDGSAGALNTLIEYCHIRDMKLLYTNTKGYVDIFSKKEYDPDILYTNEINEKNVEEMDDIELITNSYSPNVGSYSYVLYKEGDNYDFVQNVTNIITNESKLMEEHLVNKLASYYSIPKLNYFNTLQDKNIHPYNLIIEDMTNKIMVINGIKLNLTENNIDITLSEQ